MHFQHYFETVDDRREVRYLFVIEDAADDQLEGALRAAFHNQRMQQTISTASKLSCGLASDSQRIGIIKCC